MGGGGGKGGGTSYQSSSVQIPAEVLARYNAVNQRAEQVAQQPFQEYGGQFVAPVTQTQQGGINTITNAAGTDTGAFNQGYAALNQGLGASQPLYNTAAGQIAGATGTGADLTNQGLATAGNAAQTANPYNTAAGSTVDSAYGATNPINQAALGLAAAGTQAVNAGQLDVNKYMSPYNDAVVQSTLAQLSRQQKQDQNSLRDQMIMSGSFGGDRSGVAAANLANQQGLAYGQLAAGLYNQNYSQALGAAQQQQGVNLSADQANRAALAQGASNLAGIGNQQFQQGLGAASAQLGIGNQVYGQGMGLSQAQMQGANQLYQQGLGAASANTGLGQAQANQGIAAGTTYGQLGSQQLQNQLSQGQAQLGAGTVEQQTQQADLTAKYNQFLQQQGYPFQVAQFLANIALGTGAQSGSTTNTVQTQAQPYFSDPKLKRNIQEIGRTNDGMRIIRFNYGDDPNTHIGLDAEEVADHHPDAVGLAHGYKTVDYKAATDEAARKAGGGGLSAGNDNVIANLLAQQRAMYPFGDANARGIPGEGGGQGPHGVTLAPIKATPIQGAKVDMQRPSSESGAKRDLNSISELYGMGKGLASAYSEGRDALVGTAGKDGKDGTQGWFGAGGKWDSDKGSVAGLFRGANDNGLAAGKITSEVLPEIAAPEVADAGLLYASGGRTRYALGGEMPYGGAPTIVPGGGGKAGAGLLAGKVTGDDKDDPDKPKVTTAAANFDANPGGGWRTGGRVALALGGVGSMPYAQGYIPEELYTPKEPEKPDEPDKPKDMGGKGGGSGGSVGKSVGSLVGTGIGMATGMPFLGALGGMLGGLFNAGGRVGLATGGTPEEEEAERIALEDPSNVLPFARPQHAAKPRLEDRVPPPQEAPPVDMLREAPPAGLGTAKGVPTLPDGTPIDDGRPAASAAPASGLASGVPAMPPTKTITDRPQPAEAPAAAATPEGRKLVDYLVSQHGIQPMQAAMMVGNLQAESSLNPTQVHDQGTGYGMGGWRLDRRQALYDFAKQQGRDVNDPLLQADFYAQELKSRPEWGSFSAAKTPEDAQRALMTYFRPQGWTPDNPEAGHNYAGRLANGRALMGLNAPADVGAGAAGAGVPAGLASGQTQLNDTPAGQPAGFLERAGGWIDRNQRPIMAGLAFIGNMLGSKSHQLTGAIGEGLAAAAPFYLNTGYKETELGQRQQQINITERSQLMNILNQLRQQQAAVIKTQGSGDPRINAEIAKVVARITSIDGMTSAGSLPGVGGTGGTGGPTNLKPQAGQPTAPAAPGGAGAAPMVLPPQAGQPAAPGEAAPASGAPETQGVTPTIKPAQQPSAEGGPYAMPAPNMDDPAFKSQINPEVDPDVWLAKARELARYDAGQAKEAYARSNELREQLRTTGRTLDRNNQTLWVPGFREMQAAEQRVPTNQQYAQVQQNLSQQRQVMRQQLDALRKVLDNYESGGLESRIQDVNKYLSDLNLPTIGGNKRADYEKFMKEATATMLQATANMPASHGPTDALRESVSHTFVNPDLRPEANRQIIANTVALTDWSDKFYTDLTQQLEKTPWLDTRRYFDDWQKANPLAKFTKQANKDISAKGQDVPKAMNDLEDGRRYIMTPQQVFTLMGSHPDEQVRDGVTIGDVKKKFGGAGTKAFRVKRREDGTIDLVPE